MKTKSCNKCKVQIYCKRNSKKFCNSCQVLVSKEEKKKKFASLSNEQRKEIYSKRKYLVINCIICDTPVRKRQDSVHSGSLKCISCARKNPNREIVLLKEKARKEMYSLLHNTLKRLKKQKAGNTVEILGYSALDLYNHIDKNLKVGMTWENRSEWDIDHIKPVAQFIKEGIFEPKEINALSNLQPLWRIENLQKGTAWITI